MVEAETEDKPVKTTKSKPAAKTSKAKADKEPASEAKTKEKPAAKASKSKAKAAE